MGWPRRRRQQQQQLRRRAAKDYLLTCCNAALDMCGGAALLAPAVTTKVAAATETHATKSSYRQCEQTSKWNATVSPRKQQHAPLTGRRRHTGLREKLYSVDSLAETEPEDDDEEEDETESESGEPSPLYRYGATTTTTITTTTTTMKSMATAHQIESTIPEETTSKLLLENNDDDGDLIETDDEEEDRYSSSSNKSPGVPISVAPVVVSVEIQKMPTEPTDQQQVAETESSSFEDTTTDVKLEARNNMVVDGEDTESEDEMTLDAIISSCSVTIEEVGVTSQSATPVIVETADACSSNSVDLFGQTLEAENENEEKVKEPMHAPFLFPAPYFPGDIDEYESDIYETLLRREKAHHVESDYFGFQPHVTPVMRSMLLDWVVEVHNHFNLQPDTLYLTVNYIDRFLATVPVKRENFQLVALTALLISSKFEEVHPVDIEDLVYICERSYTAQQIVQFERQMLAALKFNLVVPTCSGFVEYYTDKLCVELVEAQLANFICEQTLLDFHLSAKYVPSVVASSALLLAKCSVAKHKPELAWVLEFEETTGYYAKDIWCCVHDLSDMLASLPFDLMAVRTKYRASRFGRVADLPHVNVSAMAIE